MRAALAPDRTSHRDPAHRPSYVLLVGGAAANGHIAEVVADVLGAPVCTLASSDASAAALGAAHLAAWSLARHDDDRLAFDAFLALRPSSALQLVAEPDLHATEQYDACLPEHRRLVRAVDLGLL